MAIAGRVAIVPKGEWSQSVTYDKLDLVTYNGNTFIAYKSSVGVEPVDGDTWMLVMQGIDPQDIENIIDGTTPVGDSNKLGGKSASEYALGTDLANYLPLTGGTVSNTLYTPLNLENTKADINTLGFNGVSGALGYLGFNAKNPVYRDTANTYYNLIHSGNVGSYALPITGGRLTGTLEFQIANNGKSTVYKNNSATVDHGLYLTDTNSSNNKATLRVSATNNRVDFVDVNNNANTILHTGNKPTGSYTGTGASRTVNTGGIGGVCIIYHSAFGISIVTSGGAICCNASGAITFLNADKLKFVDGIITMTETNSIYNNSGNSFTYQVL